MAEARRLQMQAIILSVSASVSRPTRMCLRMSSYTARIRSTKAVLSSLDGAFRDLRDTLDCRHLTFYAIIVHISARARPVLQARRVFGLVPVLTAINLKIHQQSPQYSFSLTSCMLFACIKKPSPLNPPSFYCKISWLLNHIYFLRDIFVKSPFVFLLHIYNIIIFHNALNFFHNHIFTFGSDNIIEDAKIFSRCKLDDSKDSEIFRWTSNCSHAYRLGSGQGGYSCSKD